MYKHPVHFWVPQNPLFSLIRKLTDFLELPGVHLVQFDRGQFHYHRVVFVLLTTQV